MGGGRKRGKGKAGKIVRKITELGEDLEDE